MRPLPREAPRGFRFVVSTSNEWEVPPVGVGRCRWGAGPNTKACGRPAAATLWRSTWDPSARRNVRRPWNYCEDHLYGRWIEDGRVSSWRLVADGKGDP